MRDRTADEARDDGPDDDLPACTACGVCCFFDDPRYVMVFEDDEPRLGALAAEMTHYIAGRRFMKAVDGHCVALRREGEHWLCSIYEQRPQLCRDFQRGIPTCRENVADRHPSFARKRLPQLNDGPPQP